MIIFFSLPCSECGTFLPLSFPEIMKRKSGEANMIKYDKLWETARRKGITKSMLTKKYNVSKAQLYRLRYNQPVSTNTLDRLCNILECDINEIMEHIPDNNYF